MNLTPTQLCIAALWYEGPFISFKHLNTYIPAYWNVGHYVAAEIIPRGELLRLKGIPKNK